MGDIQNYYMRAVIEKQGAIRKDTSRMKSLNHLVQSAVDLKMAINNQVNATSLFDEGEVARDCALGRFGEKKAGEVVFRHLYGNIASGANAASILIQSNFISEPRQLWRNMCESCAIISFLTKYSNSDNPIKQAYLCHTLLTSWYKKKSEYNQLCKSEGKEPHYEAEDIAKTKERLICRFGNKGVDDYAWTELPGCKPVRLKGLIREANSRWLIWYSETCREVHPTVGERVAVTGFLDPMPFIPLLPPNHIFPATQMHLDYWIAELLKVATDHTQDFLESYPIILRKATTTLTIAEQTLEELSR